MDKLDLEIEYFYALLRFRKLYHADEKLPEEESQSAQFLEDVLVEYFPSDTPNRIVSAHTPLIISNFYRHAFGDISTRDACNKLFEIRKELNNE